MFLNRERLIGTGDRSRYSPVSKRHRFAGDQQNVRGHFVARLISWHSFKCGGDAWRIGRHGSGAA